MEQQNIVEISQENSSICIEIFESLHSKHVSSTILISNVQEHFQQWTQKKSNKKIEGCGEFALQYACMLDAWRPHAI